MTIIEKLKTLIENESVDETIVFLKGLHIDEKKSLVPVLKELNVYYGETVDLTTMQPPEGQWKVGRSYGSRARGKQSMVLAIASFVCLDKKGFENTIYPNSIMTREMLDQLLAFYTPSWFGQLLADIHTNNRFRLYYDLIMHLETEGYFTPSPELILTHIPTLFYGTDILDHHAREASEVHLLKYPETLEKHFWYIFEYPSNIHNVSRYNKGAKGWHDFIVQFVAKGRLDRMRILRECLLTANRNFNKLLVGWFMDLFTLLKPTATELQTLQPVLMTVLDAKHTAAVGLALNSLKQLKEFDYNTFITHLPQVILSGTKSILTTVLQLAETICKQHAAVRQEIAIQLCQIFLNKEDAIQQKTAKLITTYAWPANEALQQQLQMYADTMLTGIRQSLVTGGGTMELATEEEPEVLPLIGEHNLIPTVNTAEDLIYFASQAFENNEPHHAELLPAIFINLQHLITEAVLVQLQPALKRAEKLRSRPAGNMGEIGYYLTSFLINAVKPSDKIVSWDVKPEFIQPYTLLFQYALEKLATKDTSPLLSTPTHTPGWIDPVVLVTRLSQYKEQAPNDLDLQIAICRCALEDTTAAIGLAKEILTGEHRDLLLFLLDKSLVSFKDGNAWIQAANRKGLDLPATKIPAVYLNGHFNWQTAPENYLAYGAYNKETREYDRVPAVHTKLTVELPAVRPLDQPYPLLQEYLINRAQYSYIHSSDIARILALTPANTSLVLATTIQHYMAFSAMYDVTENSAITAAINWLKEHTKPYTATEQLFIATCMLHADKTIRSLAAACWITGVSYKTLQSEEIGRVIGIHQSVEWAPLKRFTDLITEQLMQISKLHNEALEALLTACIELLPDAPVKNLKKLLEIYAEVLVVNGHKTTATNKLKMWEPLPGYKKLIAKMTT